MRDTNIVILGDSITYGVKDEEAGGWVNRLRLRLEREESDFYVFNLGVPADTTNDLRKRMTVECSGRFKEDARTILIFAIGINDTQLINDRAQVSLSDFKENIRSFMDEAQTYTKEILFVGLTPVDEPRITPTWWDENARYANEEIRRYDEALRELCAGRGIDYLALFDQISGEGLADGLHPDSAGHQKICEQVYTRLHKKFLD